MSSDFDLKTFVNNRASTVEAALRGKDPDALVAPVMEGGRNHLPL